MGVFRFFTSVQNDKMIVFTEFSDSLPQELMEFAKMVNGDPEAKEATGKDAYSFAGKTVKLTADIDVSTEAWTPIGDINSTSAEKFEGTFDGQNKTITININNPGGSNQGLFGNINNAVIRDVKVEGSIVGSDRAAGIAIMAHGTCSIIHCINYVSIQSNWCSGILAVAGGEGGYYDVTYLIACENHGNISGSKRIAGMVSHSNSDGYGAYIVACINHGAITGSSYVGGIIGRSYASGDKVYACLSDGEITGGDANTGGIAGWLNLGSYQDVYFVSSNASLHAVGEGNGNTSSTYPDINNNLDKINGAITKWNNDNQDYKCFYHYEGAAGALPSLIDGQP